jgi:DNA-binding MarR family transcriptional regulator
MNHATIRHEAVTERSTKTQLRGSPDDHPMAEMRYLVLAAQREGNRQLAQALRPLGLTPAQAEIISVLAERQPLTLAALGRYIVCETGSPSRIVDTLVRRGLVEREAGQIDRRVVHLRLNPLGIQMLDQINTIEHQINEMLGAQIDEQQRTTIVNALRKIVEGTIGGSKINHRFRMAGR